MCGLLVLEKGLPLFDDDIQKVHYLTNAAVKGAAHVGPSMDPSGPAHDEEARSTHSWTAMSRFT
jgi:hypothetical protein